MIRESTDFRDTTNWRGVLAALPWVKINLGLLALAALVMWGFSLKQINLSQMNDLGLISVLPWSVFVALLLLTASFLIALAQPEYSEWFAAFQIILLIFMLYGIPSLTQDVARFGASYKHVGVIDMILRTGNVDPAIDAYNNWPGFFILGALITKVAGLTSALPLLTWAPVVFNLLYLLPLRMIMLAATPDRRLVWLGIWFFYLANWVGQDYFSPQAFGFFLALVIMGILLSWFTCPCSPSWMELLRRGPRWTNHLWYKLQLWWEWFEPRMLPSRSIQRIGLLVVVILSFLVVVASHQLTPFSLLAGVMALFIFDRLWLRSLPLLLAIILGSWLTYMTVAYLSGHLEGMLSYFGQVSDTVGANLTDRLSGSPLHVLVTRLRLLMTLLLWGLAFLGGLRRVKYHRLDLDHALLALAPFPLIAMQNYGGELLMRIYLFGLPFMVFFVAALFFPRRQIKPSWRVITLAGLASAVFLTFFLFVRYGNERADYFTANEFTAMEFVYDQAESGAVLAASTTNLPVRYRGYEIYRYMFLEKMVFDQDVQGVIHSLESRSAPQAYLILTRSQKAFLQMFYHQPETAWGDFQEALLASNRFQVVYTNPDASVYLLLPSGSAEGK